MNSKVLLGALLVAPIATIWAVQDYKEQLEVAIIQSNLPRVERLLKRRNRVSLRKFQDLFGYSEDIVEERRMLDPTSREVVNLNLAVVGVTACSIAGLFYYFDLGTVKRDIKSSIGPKGFKVILGAVGLFSAKGIYSWRSGPRKRLDDSFYVQYALEDTVDDIKEKLKARKRAREKAQEKEDT